MPFVGTGHIWLIGILLIIVLIIWGPGKLPEVGSGMGRAIREFRKATSETKAEFHKATAFDAPVEAVPIVPLGQVAAAPPIPPAPVGPVVVAVPVSPGGTERVATQSNGTAAT